MTDYCLVPTQAERCARGMWPTAILNLKEKVTETLVQKMEALRTITGQCILLEASTNPKEFLCTIGWHHRGQWFKDFQVSAETAFEAVDLAKEKWLENEKMVRGEKRK